MRDHRGELGVFYRQETAFDKILSHINHYALDVRQFFLDITDDLCGKGSVNFEQMNKTDGVPGLGNGFV